VKKKKEFHINQTLKIFSFSEIIFWDHCVTHTHILQRFRFAMFAHLFSLLTAGQLGSQTSTASKWSVKFKLFHLFQTEEQEKWRLRPTNTIRKICALPGQVPPAKLECKHFCGNDWIFSSWKEIKFETKYTMRLFVFLSLLLTQRCDFLWILDVFVFKSQVYFIWSHFILKE